MSKSSLERDVEVKIFGYDWIVGIIYSSYDTLHEFDIQSLSLKCYPVGHGWEHTENLTEMIDSCSSLNHQFECAVIAKLEEDRQNV